MIKHGEFKGLFLNKKWIQEEFIETFIYYLTIS